MFTPRAVLVLPIPRLCAGGSQSPPRTNKKDTVFKMALAGKLHPVADTLWGWKSNTAESKFSQVIQYFLLTYLDSKQ